MTLETPLVDRPTISPEHIQEAAENLSTIRDFIRFGVTALRQYDAHLGQGTEDYFAESSALVLQTLSLDWNADAEILESKLLPSEKTEVLSLLERRINEKVPTSYLLNLAYFDGKPYYVDERVLIPRSPIAELIQNRFAPYCLGENGQMGEAVNNLPTDISKEALEVAQINSEHHDKQYQVALLESDLFSKIPAENQYDLIVSNPPYVDAEDMADLPEEFHHEPELALAAGQDGLDLVRKMLAQAPDYLTEDGLIVIEVGNSEWAMRQNFNTVDFYWLQFQKGGTGIFALTAAQCRQFRDLFIQSVQA